MKSKTLWPQEGGKGSKKNAGSDGGGGSSGKESSNAGSAVEVRHILCEKQGKSLKALEKLKAGQKFLEVAAAYSAFASRIINVKKW
uniref:peptidylprolyl isomerase n=1 Tax=Glossina morsitans morsitans TaxID=37546 RepID=A0A1B0FFX8_GLOMM